MSTLDLFFGGSFDEGEDTQQCFVCDKSVTNENLIIDSNLCFHEKCWHEFKEKEEKRSKMEALRQESLEREERWLDNHPSFGE